MTTVTAADAPTVLLEFMDEYGVPAGEHGPERLVREVFGPEPDEFQLVALRAFGRGERQISLESCHGPGKTFLLAMLVWCMLLTRFPMKTACTAPTSGQMYDALYAEIKSWGQKLAPELLSLFKFKTGQQGGRIELIAAPDDSFVTLKTARAEQPEALAGIHQDAGFVLLIADEASGVPEVIFESALSSMSGKYATTVLAGNPVRTGGFFYNSHHSDSAHRWFRIHVPAVWGPHCEKPGPDGQGSYVSKRVSREFVEMMAEEYGEDSNPYNVRVLGRPPKTESDAVIPFEWIETARTRDVVPNPRAPVVWGMDVARARTGDLTVLVKRRANVLLDVKTYVGVNDVMIAVGHLKSEWDITPHLDRPIEINIDAIGLGAGVADRARELKLPARAVNVSENPAINGSRFRNLRTELWFAARDWFGRRDCSIANADERLVHELGAQKYKPIESSGKVICIPKDEMRKYIHPRRSPDRADAFVLTFAGVYAGLLTGTRTSWDTPVYRNLKGLV